MELDKSCSAGRGPDDLFWGFYHLVLMRHLDLQTISFLRLGSWKHRYIYIYIYMYFGRLSTKESLSTVRLKYLFTNLRRARWTLTLNVNLLQTSLANCWGYLAKFLLCTSPLAALFRTFSLSLHFLSSKSSFLDDHFTTQHSDFLPFFRNFFKLIS